MPRFPPPQRGGGRGRGHVVAVTEHRKLLAPSLALPLCEEEGSRT